MEFVLRICAQPFSDFFFLLEFVFRICAQPEALVTFGFRVRVRVGVGV
jgi:hypothetical protein